MNFEHRLKIALSRRVSSLGNWYTMQFTKTFSAPFRIVFLGSLILASSAKTEEPPKPDFGKQIWPLIKQNCVACHRAGQAEGGLILESHEAIMKGGDGGPPVVAGDSKTSEIIARITATDDTSMPPIDNKVGATRLADHQVELVRQWIDQGAIVSPVDMSSETIQWEAIPESLQPVYAMAMSTDDSELAFSRGNRLYVSEIAADGQTRASLELVRDGKAAHADLVQSIAFSPDGQWLASGGYREVNLWKRSEAIDSATIPLLQDRPRWMASSPDGKWIAKATASQFIELWSTDPQERRLQVATDGKEVVSLAVNATGTLVAYATNEHQVITLGAPGVEAKFDPYIVGEPIRSVLMVGETLIVLTASGVVRSPALPEPLVVDQAVQQIVPWGDDTLQFLMGTENGTVGLVTIADKTISKQWPLGQPVRALACSSDRSRVAVACADGITRLVQTDNGTVLKSLQGSPTLSRLIASRQRDVERQVAQVDGLAKQIPELTKAAEVEDQAVAKVMAEKDKAVLELEEKKKATLAAAEVVAGTEKGIAEAKAEIEAITKRMEALSVELEANKKKQEEATAAEKAASDVVAKREQAFLAAQDSQTRARLAIETKNQEIGREGEFTQALTAQLDAVKVQEQAKNATVPTALSFVPGQTTLLIAAGNDQLSVYEPEGRWRQVMIPPTESPIRMLVTLAQVTCLGVTDGSVQAVSLRPFWNLARTIGGDSNSPIVDRALALTFSPDGKQLAVGGGQPSRSGDLKLFDIEAGTLTHDFGDIHSDCITSVRFSPDGRRLATGSADKTARLWDAGSRQLLATLEGHTHHVLGVDWQDDGLTLATAGADNAVKIWNMRDGTQRISIGGFGKEVTSIRFVERSGQILSSSADGQVRLHNSADAGLIRNFPAASGYVYTIAVSSDGLRAAYGGQDGKMRSLIVADGKQIAEW